MSTELGFELGKEVRVITPDGEVLGVIGHYYRNTQINQFSVRFFYDGREWHQCFSKKTGKIYGSSRYKALFKAIIN